jgi:hypothetical protein
VLRTHCPACESNAQPRPITAIGGAGGEGGEGGGVGGDGGGDGRFWNRLIPAPPMRKRLGVCSWTAFAERTRESTSAAARIISLTSATERVGSFASTWAATPETCGAAILVPLMVLVAVLLEPTQAPRILEPGACAHARRGLCPVAGGRAGGRGRLAAGGRTCTGGIEAGGGGGEDLHMDARAVVGEIGRIIAVGGGAND